MQPDLVVEHWWAVTFGWPPQVVRELPLDAYEWFPVIHEAKARAAALKDRAARPGLGNGRAQAHMRG